MVFLNPSILIGLAAASIPVLIHFLNLRKLKRIEFSSIRFLKELQKTKIRRIKFKQWLLLLLRTLIIIFLVLTFARPTIESVSLGGTTSAAKTAAVFVVDNSFSMSIVTSEGSIFNQAKLTASNILDQFQQGDDLSIILSTNSARAVSSSNPTKMKDVLQEIEISELKGNILESLNYAANLISASKNFNKEIYIFTDLQKSNFNAGKEKLKLRHLDEHTKIFIFDFSTVGVTNLGLTGLDINNQIFERGKNINLTARVKNYSSEKNNNSLVSLFVNKKRSAQRSIELGAGESASLDFQITLGDPGLLEIFAELENDDILPDNKYFAGIFIPEQINILLLYDIPEDKKYIESALLADLNSKSFNLKSINARELNSQTLNKYQLVILIGGKDLTAVDPLVEFIRNGGGFMLFPSSSGISEKYIEICMRLNLSAPQSVVSTELNSPFYFDTIELDHPLFKNIFGDNSKRKIDSPEIYKFIKTGAQKSGMKIISMQNGSSFLSENNLGMGKILAFGTSPVPGWSSFPFKGLFAPLIYRSVYFLGGSERSSQNYTAGGEVKFKVSRVSSLSRIIDPSNGESVISYDSVKSKKYYELKRAEKPGIYKLMTEEGLMDYAVVNFDPDESAVDKLPGDELEASLQENGYSGSVYVFEKTDDYLSRIYQSRYGSELWKLFLIAALALSVIEMMVSKSSKKDIVNLN